MARIYLLTAITILVLTYAIWNPTNAFFTDSSIASANTFTAANEFPTPTVSTTPSPTSEVTPTATPTNTPTPTSTVTPVPGKIVINEVSPLGASASAEWIELYNSGGTPIDITNWTISDSESSDTLPSTPMIAPNSYAIIVTSNSVVTGIPGSAVTIHLTGTSGTQIGGGLLNSGDLVRLKDQTNVVIDEMSYGSDKSVYTLTAPTGVQTLRRIPNGVDTNFAGDWSLGAPSIGVSN